MTVCNRCGKENQDHYKFCLGCGAELTAAPKPGGGDMGMMKTMMADPGQAPDSPARRCAGHRPRCRSRAGARRSAARPAMPRAARRWPRPAACPDAARSRRRPDGRSAAMPPPMGPPPGVPGFSPGFAPPAQPPACGAARRAAATSRRRSGSAARAASAWTRRRRPTPMPSRPRRRGRWRAAAPQRARLSMTLIRPDGTEGGTHELRPGENKLGRSFGPVFENDGYLSPVHAHARHPRPNGDGARPRLASTACS